VHRAVTHDVGVIVGAGLIDAMIVGEYRVAGAKGGKPVTTYREPGNREWSQVMVRGTPMERCSVFEAHGTQSALFRMKAGCQIPDHHHANWVQVAVLSGQMRVEQEGSPMRQIPAGGVYFVDPGEDHVETAEVETVVLVTQPAT
jgi:quercetin dioxygenase-like cupin family protein